ncbi:hypothetical protein DCS32_14180 [Dokdonia sp. Dokd-P16]|uniref:hypothetical protein n=1 Tax=Dokdonia sp. Dokd-P16 TaxID=2173169 RepID=UPI000D54A4CE|nr:hypothetical protein [Dokdonia sp. Dokd-P16]AWH75270.1 hypothetical protein DCS32_14180 [Dokdonia sp. Dokd-P16]
MKNVLLILLIITTQFAASQTETEIFLLDINKADNGDTLTNKRNISNNPGYDSQPQFLANDIIIYAGERDGQTEIIQYTRGTTRQFNKATSGGEYSPQFMKGKRGISAVRLDPDGLQRLYSYLPRQDKAPVLIKDAVVAYYTWADKNFIVGADIVESNLHLVIHNVKNQTSDDLEILVGRSFHNIPDTNLISFIDKSTDQWVVKSINPNTKKIKSITELPEGVEDINWLPDGTLLAAKGNTLLSKTKNSAWEVYHTFEDEELQDISRFAISPNGSQIAIVAAKKDKK